MNTNIAYDVFNFFKAYIFEDLLILNAFTLEIYSKYNL